MSSGQTRKTLSQEAVGEARGLAPAHSRPSRLTAALCGLRAHPPEPGTNAILVTHTLNIQSALGLDIEEGEAVAVRPDGAGSFTGVARVLAKGWSALRNARLPRRVATDDGRRRSQPTAPD
jgi:hypothetical protein